MDQEHIIPSQKLPTGNLCKDMKSEHVEKLKEEYHKGHSSCLQKIEQWNKFKQDYEVLKGRLETLPDQISYDIMVPFGSHAFMPGKLIHTNEVLTLLGANWFAEVSAKHAAEISTRRIKQCDKMLEDLNKEKVQFENWLKYISEITGGDLVNIVEHWDEEKWDQWREQHSKNVKAYKQKQAEMNISSSKEKEIPKDVPVEKNSCSAESDKDYSQLLNDLEEQEVAGDEMNESPSELDDDDDDDDDEDDLDNDSEGSDREKNSEEEEENTLDDQLKNNEKHVKWKDQEGEKMKNCITFTHSSRKCKSHSKPIAISKGKAKHKESVPLSPVKIQSPSDIYKCFSTKPDQSKPKSILKRTTSVDEADMLNEVIDQPASNKNSPDVPVLETRFKEQTAFTGEIVEHEMDKVSLSDKSENTAQRAPSRFKAQRQNKHR